MSKSGFATEHLRSFLERIERLESEKAALTADIAEVYSEAKGTGFDTKIMRQVVRLRKMDKADFQEQQAILDLYLTAVGMSGTPLGAYAERQEPKAQTTAQFAATAEIPAEAPKHPTTKYNLETGEVTGDPPPAALAKTAKQAVTPAPAESAPGELPAFLDRRIKKPAKVLEAAE